MNRNLWTGLFLSVAIGLLVSCGGEYDPAIDGEMTLRDALTRPTAELEMEDLVARRELANRIFSEAERQSISRDQEEITNHEQSAPSDTIAQADQNRANRELEPIILATAKTEDDLTTVEATGDSRLLTPAGITQAEVSSAITVGVGFPTEQSEALGGRSEAQTVEDFSVLLENLGGSADSSVASWTVMRREGLLAGMVFLPEEAIIELNPTLLYYISALSRPNQVTGTATTSATDPEATPPSSDWDTLMRWLQDADPSSWTNLNSGASQTMDSGTSTEQPPTRTTAPCPCCFCSSFGTSSPLQGVAVLLGVFLPLGALLFLRRRS